MTQWRCWTHSEGQEALGRAYDRAAGYAREAQDAAELDNMDAQRDEPDAPAENEESD